MFIVYKITNVINNKIYFGYTSKTLKYRWKAHSTEKRNRIISNNIKKYGEDNFTMEEMYTFESAEEAKSTEIYLISRYQTNIIKFPCGNGMNMTDGGEGTHGYKHSKETIKHLKLIQRNRPKEWNDKISLGHKGKVLSDEHKEKIGKSCTGKIRTEEQKQKIRGENNHFFGRTHTNKTKDIIRQYQTKNMKGVYQRDKNNNLLNTFVSICEASRALGIGKGEIIKVCKGKSKTAGGFIWEYVNG